MNLPVAVPLDVLDAQHVDPHQTENELVARIDGEEADAFTLAIERFREFVGSVRMTPLQRQALGLHLEGLNYGEIGRLAGCTRRVAKRRVNAAIGRLQRVAVTQQREGGGME